MTRLLQAGEAVRRAAGQEPDLLFVDVRSIEAWRGATIPGALQLNVYDYFIPSSDEAGFADIESAIAAAMAESGIDKAKTVVFFEEKTGMVSPRALWFHEFAGLTGGYVLDGGIQAWLAAGGLATGGRGSPHAIASRPDLPKVAPMRRELIASIEDVLHPGAAVDIFDVRRPTEFSGSFAHDCCSRAGHVPGAKFMFYEEVLAGGHYKSPTEMGRLFAEAGLSAERTIITYCHRGARAATAYVGLREAGYSDVRIFVGSWHEWASRADLPLVMGI
jgi:thiosulfate/3-mercaptopyruvate sulfurtransferase